MRKLVFAGVTLAALGIVQPAMAADLDVGPYKVAPLIVPVYDWTGFYVGISGGFSEGRSSNVYTITGFAPVSDSTKMDGGVFGGQIGYNWQPARSFVLGVEADLQGTWQNGSDNPTGTSTTSCVAGIPLCTTTANAVGVDEKLRWFGTARGRVGFVPWDNVMLFVTGGVAFGEVEWNETTTNTVTTTLAGTSLGTTTAINSGTATATHAGWTVGGGSEWVLSGGWTGKLEYLFVDLGTIGNSYVSNAGVVPTVVESSHVRDNIIRIGLNYRFGGPVVARY
ncbi:MAG: porin family protein [Hyphomicrobiales bacterium]|nr:porin family protein [Hyphomicrobiales bacterium]MBV8823841.1 porin family protein [Hyphomicrobiales bacterium]MBV9430006.1 porin family protein [Bradyrhizobiaceae bacterium]